MLGIIVGVIVVVSSLFVLFWTRKKYLSASRLESLALCESENCVRCNKNEAVMANAKCVLKRNERYLRTKVADAILAKSYSYILYCSWLPSRAIWTREDLPYTYLQDYDLLRKSIPIFIKDFYEVQHNHGLSETVNGWNKFYFVNQGQRNVGNMAECKATCDVLDKCNNLMSNCMFAFAFFSVLRPNSFISEHRGPSNARLRCHVSIKVPQPSDKLVCNMAVNDVKHVWKANNVLFFDDSLSHSVEFSVPNNDAADSRVVLLLDFWHPALTSEEIECIQNCYPS